MDIIASSRSRLTHLLGVAWTILGKSYPILFIADRPNYWHRPRSSGASQSTLTSRNRRGGPQPNLPNPSTPPNRAHVSYNALRVPCCARGLCTFRYGIGVTESRSFAEEINFSVWNSLNTVRCHIKTARFEQKQTKDKLLGFICFKLLRLLRVWTPTQYVCIYLQSHIEGRYTNVISRLSLRRPQAFSTDEPTRKTLTCQKRRYLAEYGRTSETVVL